MKPAAFDYVRARDAASATKLLVEAGDGGRLIAGGQSLGPMLNLRLTRPGLLIDIGRAADLRASTSERHGIRIGAATTHAEIEDGQTPCGADGFLPRFARGIAYRAVRNRGTIGGSLAHADPAADWPLALTVLDASVEIAGPSRTRQVKMTDFIKGPFATALEDGELIAAVHIPAPSAVRRWGSWKLCRKAGEFPIASAAVADFGDGWRVCLGALPDRPRLVTGFDRIIAQASSAAPTPAALLPHLVDVLSDVDAIDRQMFAGCLARAFSQALAA